MQRPCIDISEIPFNNFAGSNLLEKVALTSVFYRRDFQGLRWTRIRFAFTNIGLSIQTVELKVLENFASN